MRRRQRGSLWLTSNLGGACRRWISSTTRPQTEARVGTTAMYDCASAKNELGGRSWQEISNPCLRSSHAISPGGRTVCVSIQFGDRPSEVRGAPLKIQGRLADISLCRVALERVYKRISFALLDGRHGVKRSGRNLKRKRRAMQGTNRATYILGSGAAE